MSVLLGFLLTTFWCTLSDGDALLLFRLLYSKQSGVSFICVFVWLFCDETHRPPQETKTITFYWGKCETCHGKGWSGTMRGDRQRPRKCAPPSIPYGTVVLAGMRAERTAYDYPTVALATVRTAYTLVGEVQYVLRSNKWAHKCEVWWRS